MKFHGKYNKLPDKACSFSKHQYTNLQKALYYLYLELKFKLFYLDVDECSNKNGGCAHTCTNTVGGYHCQCKIGYALVENKHGCKGNID